MKQAESARKAHSCIIMQTQKPVDASGLSVDANKQRQCSRTLPGGHHVCAPFFRFFAWGQTKQPKRKKLLPCSISIDDVSCCALFNLSSPIQSETPWNRGEQKAQGCLILHLKCKTQVIRQYRAQAVKDAHCEQAKMNTWKNIYSQVNNLVYIHFGWVDTDGSCHTSPGPFPSAISLPWQMSRDCTPATGMVSQNIRSLHHTVHHLLCCQYNLFRC